MRRIFALVVVLASLTAALALAEPPAPVPVVVELFTSEGCSSCPPADDVLAKLEGRQAIAGADVIALGEHVTYWDRLGWKDRFSAEAFTARQEDYGRRFHLGSVYTPQTVVNGEAEMVGSYESRVRSAIQKAAKEGHARVDLSRQPGDSVAFKVTGLAPEAKGADVVLAVTEGHLETSVARGENGGRKLRHTGVVRSLAVVGHVDSLKNGAYASQARFHVDPSWKRENVKLVVFVQDHASRKILGAAAIGL
jgi:hypothetical protein